MARARGATHFGGFLGSFSPEGSEAPDPTDAARVTEHQVEVWLQPNVNIDTEGCTGGGTVAQGTNPPADATLAGKYSPLVWLELDDGISTTYRWSKVPISIDDNYKEPRIISMGTVSRGLTRLEGTFEVGTLTVVLSDYDRVLRGLHADKKLRNKQVNIYAIHEADLRNAETPRRVGQFVIRKYQAQSNLQFRLELEDFFGSVISEFSSDKKVSQRTFRKELFPSLPEELVGKAIPICYGDLSDDADPTTEPSGCALTTPTGISATVYMVPGNTGSTTYNYALTLTNDFGMNYDWTYHGGETDAAYITVNNCPSIQQMFDGLGFVVVGVDHQECAVHGRAYGHTGTEYCGLNGLDSPGAWGIVPIDRWEFTHGGRPYHRPWGGFPESKHCESHPPDENLSGEQVAPDLDSQGVVPAYYVGPATGALAGWDMFVVCGHAIKFIRSVYGSDLKEPASRVKLSATILDTDFLIPGRANWTSAVGAANYRDIVSTDPVPVTERFTIFYARGYRAIAAGGTITAAAPVGDADPSEEYSKQSSMRGTVPFAVNICGIEDVGDGTGTMIDSLVLQVQHILVNFVLQNYKTGNWLAVPTTGSPAYAIVDTESFADAQTISEARIAGGYLGAFIIPGEGIEQISVSQLVEMLTKGSDLRLGINRHGQLMASMQNPSASTTLVLRDQTDILVDGLTPEIGFDQTFNKITYSYARRYLQPVTNPTPTPNASLPPSNQQTVQDWYEFEHEVSDATSISELQETKENELELWLVRDGPTADSIAAKILARQVEPVTVQVKSDLRFADLELGQIVAVTHFAGLDDLGWSGEKLEIFRIQLNLDDFSAIIEGDDVTNL